MPTIPLKVTPQVAGLLAPSQVPTKDPFARRMSTKDSWGVGVERRANILSGGICQPILRAGVSWDVTHARKTGGCTTFLTAGNVPVTIYARGWVRVVQPNRL